MNQRTIRWIIALGTISVVSILVIQIFWVKRAYDIRENEFNDSVSRALSNVSDDFFLYNNTPPPAESPIKQFDSNYYLVMINSPIDANMLDYLLKKEFKEESIFIDFEYGIYDCDTEAMVYGDYVHNQLISNPIQKLTELPVWGNEDYYFGVMFPSKTGYIINNMGTWVFSSILMLLLMGFFGYAVVVILKQRRLSEIQKDFINNMTHEFKTPISTISVSAEVLQQPDISDNPDRLAKYAAIIEKENNRLKNQVDRVLQMAMLDKDRINLKNERVNMHEVIQRVIDTHTISNPEVSITCELKAEFPEVKGDQLHLSNIIYNLMDNAVKYGGPSGAITIETRNNGKHLFIYVTDEGPGIPKEYQRKIFSRFYRIPTGDVHNVKGFGLGLHYVKRMLISHGGSISIQNNEPTGCTFQIHLPYEK